MAKKLIAFLLFVIFCAPTLSYAASPWTSNPTYGEKISGKLDFGVKNLIAGWTEIYTQPNKAFTEKTNIAAGVGRGLANAFVNTLGGALQAATFFIPVDIPIPGGGVQLREATKVDEKEEPNPVTR
jgi:hypothetical protein